jgi:hypothetical protein
MNTGQQMKMVEKKMAFLFKLCILMLYLTIVRIFHNQNKYVKIFFISGTAPM